AVPGARAEGGAAIPGHADESDVEPRRVALDRQAHEGRDLAKARHDHAGKRLWILGVWHDPYIGSLPPRAKRRMLPGDMQPEVPDEHASWWTGHLVYTIPPR